MSSDFQHIATGRTRSLFDSDIEQCGAAITEVVRGRRVLAIGAAGSIGSNTVLTLLRHGPQAMHLIDQNENGLAELIRMVRARPDLYACGDIKALPLDFGSRALRLFLRSEPTYDLVLNFAAIKHVRSEKDPFSTLQMLDTNIVKQARLIEWLAQSNFKGRFFTVSTDKAANPSSMMGATKRVMEHVMFNSAAAHKLAAVKTAARFANVAFSNGSLLEGFMSRLARGEPLAAPRDTRRYFVSLRESGQICAIAACHPPSGSIIIPKLDPRDHLVLLEDVAERFLAAHGYEAVRYDDEAAACADVARLRGEKRWPLLLTPLDTSGEKPYEEFMTEHEEVFEIGLPNLKAVRYLPADGDLIDRLVDRARDLTGGGDDSATVDKDEIKRLIGSVEPAFLRTHRDSLNNLDQRL
jgi:FlaA1/EpsC-like NDP-sugar epimerase